MRAYTEKELSTFTREQLVAIIKERGELLMASRGEAMEARAKLRQLEIDYEKAKKGAYADILRTIGHEHEASKLENLRFTVDDSKRIIKGSIAAMRDTIKRYREIVAAINRNQKEMFKDFRFTPKPKTYRDPVKHSPMP